MPNYLVQIIVCILFLLALVVIARLLIKRKQPLLASFKKNHSIEIIDKKQIGKKEQLLLIKLENQLLLIGATSHNINLIKQINGKEV